MISGASHNSMCPETTIGPSDHHHYSYSRAAGSELWQSDNNAWYRPWFPWSRRNCKSSRLHCCLFLKGQQIFLSRESEDKRIHLGSQKRQISLRQWLKTAYKKDLEYEPSRETTAKTRVSGSIGRSSKLFLHSESINLVSISWSCKLLNMQTMFWRQIVFWNVMLSESTVPS